MKRIKKWINGAWNKRRTSAVEKRLRKELESLKDENEKLREEARQLEHDKQIAQDATYAAEKNVEFMAKALECDQRYLETIIRQHGMKAMPEEHR